MKTIFSYFFTILLFTTSCTKVANDGIPCYIKLTNPTIESSSISQGSNLHQFTDLWIQSNGINLGAYEYPATFAALLKGEQKVTINPGIYYNESLTERVVYRIFEPFEANYNFIQKDTIEISPVFKYKELVDFLIIEDFESSNNFSNTSRTNIGDLSNLENKAGIITLSSNATEINVSTITPLAIPSGRLSYLEFSMKSESFVKISVAGAENALNLGIFKPTSGWQTFYFDISLFINAAKENQYHFYLDIQKNNLTEEEKTYIDNFKIIQY